MGVDALCGLQQPRAIEAEVKRDDSIRHALEAELAAVVPEIARAFAQGQDYLARSDISSLDASFRGGDFQLGTTKLAGSLVQSRKRARESVKTMLERAGLPGREVEAALDRLDAAKEGDLTQITDGIAVRHGSVGTFVLPYDGEFISDHFPPAMAFHLLAFFVGERIYDEALNPIRSAILEQRNDPDQVMVERLIDRSTGYVPKHVLGLSKSAPHLVMRVQLFGPLVWQVHLLRVSAPKLEPAGMALDLRERAVIPAAPRKAAATS